MDLFLEGFTHMQSVGSMLGWSWNVRRTVRLIGIATAVFASVLSSYPACSQQTARQQYSDKISADYNFRFGKDQPFAPGNPDVQGEGFIQPGAFPDATYCAHCHKEAYHQWRQALHSNSFRTPFYRTSVNLLIKNNGIEFSRHCDSCHNPIGVLSGALTQNSHVDRKFDQDGLTCATCHSIQALKSTSGNGAFVMGVPSVLVDEKGNRIPGEVPYYEIMKHPDRHSKAVMQSFYRTPEFCAACHKANLPEHLNDFKFLSAFSTYDEWQNSKFSKRNPLTFYSGDFTTCQGCHMKRAPNLLLDYGAKNGTFASHSWLAGNTAVPFYYGFDEQLEKTIKFLQADNYLNVDIFGIMKASDKKLIGPLGTVPFQLEPNSVIDVYVVVQSKNIGHSLIPEVRDLYEAWVEFEATDAQGKVFYHSGFLKPDGMLDERAHSFTNRPVDKDGEFVDNHQVQTIHAAAYDNTIQAGRSVLVRYRFAIPANSKGPLTITAKVNYRHLRQSYLNNIFGKDHPAYPVVELASRSRTLYIGDNLPIPAAPEDNPDWMRWNNLGISYLDAQRYAEAVDAFHAVLKLRPDYADGYTNIALTEISWEKYGSAFDNVQKALSLSPNNARALYYSALLERRAGHPSKELADLLEVEKQYPQSRDAKRELGVAYFRQGNYEMSKSEFEALLAIDPDDLSAHYNLAILYHRMGMIGQAKEQMALFTTEKINSTARTLALAFLRNHPNTSIESIPWHVHTDLPPSATNSSQNKAERTEGGD